MQYLKKMCILRQVKQGFSGDGKALSGLIKIEQYGKNVAIEVSVINFAPLLSGEYYCVVADEKHRTEILPLRGKSIFNILSDIDITDGFCAVICYIKNEIIPLAYGINGNHIYDWKSILNATLPPTFDKKQAHFAAAESIDERREEGDGKMQFDESENEKENEIKNRAEPTAQTDENAYNDERVATENYYMEMEENGQELSEKISDNARLESTTEKQDEKTGADFASNGDADGVLHPFETETDGYYRSVKGEMDELLKNYPRDDTLLGAFSSSEWVRIQGEEGNPQYLVGLIYENEKAKYVCYALAAENKDAPPEEIKDVCTYVPLSPYDENRGFFIIFQSAATGECIKPERA